MYAANLFCKGIQKTVVVTLRQAVGQSFPFIPFCPTYISIMGAVSAPLPAPALLTPVRKCPLSADPEFVSGAT